MLTAKIQCPRARERIRLGIPATVEHPSQKPATSGTETNATNVATATENFITLLDAIQIGMLEKDSLHPLLSDLILSVNEVTTKDFEDKPKIVKWLRTLNQMEVAEKLSESQAREFQFEMKQAYNGFKATLSK